MLDFYINTEHSEAIDLKTIITVLGTLVSVWFGAFLQNNKECKISKKERFQRILELQLDINLIESYILAYEDSMDKVFFIDDLPSLQKLDISFNHDLKEYTFLTNYNAYFISLLDVIARQTRLVQELINVYIDLIHDFINTANLDANQNLLLQIHSRLKHTLDEIKKAIKGLKILIVIYNLVIKNSVQGNLDYAYNLRLGENIGSLSYEHISEYKEHPLYENWNKIIKNGKRNPKNIRCMICSFIDKIKLSLANFIGFFTYKPQNCRKDKGEKTNDKSK